MTTSDDAALREQAKVFVKFILENGGVSRNRSADDTESIMLYMDKYTATAVQAAREDTIWNIMSPKTEGLFDGGDLFIKRAPIEQAIINMVGLEKWKAMQEAVDAQLQADAGRSGGTE